jgi:HSP20 family molecular chaperone IbpA
MQKRRREFDDAAEEIEQLFADLWQVFPFSRGMRRGYRPQVDVYRTEDPPSLTVVVELPGVDHNEVKVVASARALLIAGERRRPKESGHYQQMTLADDIDPDGATATYEGGLLIVRLPIAPRPEPRQSISIMVTSR